MSSPACSDEICQLLKTASRYAPSICPLVFPLNLNSLMRARRMTAEDTLLWMRSEDPLRRAEAEAVARHLFSPAQQQQQSSSGGSIATGRGGSSGGETGRGRGRRKSGSSSTLRVWEEVGAPKERQTSDVRCAWLHVPSAPPGQSDQASAAKSLTFAFSDAEKELLARFDLLSFNQPSASMSGGSSLTHVRSFFALTAAAARRPLNFYHIVTEYGDELQRKPPLQRLLQMFQSEEEMRDYIDVARHIHVRITDETRSVQQEARQAADSQQTTRPLLTHRMLSHTLATRTL